MGNFLYLCYLILSLFSMSNININDYYEMNNLRIEYGSYQNDGYLSIFNYDNDEYLFEQIYDDGFIEDFIYLAEVKSDFFIMVCKRSFYVGDIKEINDYLLIKYDLSGKIISTHSISMEYQFFYNHHNTLIAENTSGDFIYLNIDLEEISNITNEDKYVGEYKEQFQGEAYINGLYAEEINLVYPGIYNIEIRDNDYSYQYSITIDPDVIIKGDVIDDNYYGEIQLYSFGKLYLNGELYTSGETIKEAGEYILEIYGPNDYVKSITLFLYSYIYYNNGEDNFILNQDSYINHPIRLFAKNTDLFVNGEIYNNELINKPGTYQLYYNLQNIEENIEFNIYPRIEGILNNEVYSSVVDFYVFGEAIINGEKYQGLVSISEPGKYRLELYFNTDIYQTIDFEIQKHSSKPNISNYLKYGFIGILGIGVFIFFWKK